MIQYITNLCKIILTSNTANPFIIGGASSTEAWLGLVGATATAANLRLDSSTTEGRLSVMTIGKEISGGDGEGDDEASGIGGDIVGRLRWIGRAGVGSGTVTIFPAGTVFNLLADINGDGGFVLVVVLLGAV